MSRVQPSRRVGTLGRSLARDLGGAGLCLVLLCFLGAGAHAATFEEIEGLLRKADTVKLMDPTQFIAALESLETNSLELTDSQKLFLQYLRGWQQAYDGEYDAAITTLKGVLSSTSDTTLQFRARATIVNVLLLTKRYEEGFVQLNSMTTQLQELSDPAAREQGMAVAALFYNQVGQHDLALSYADRIAKEDPTGASRCKSSQFRIDALVKSGKLKEVGRDINDAIAACVEYGETIRANVIRSHAAKIYIAQQQYDKALKILKDNYEEVKATRYAHLIAEYDASFAKSYFNKGEYDLAKQFASDAVRRASKDEYIGPIVSAYQVLYSEASRRRDFKSALEYHEKYAVADKGYLDDISAQQLAYQRVKQQVEEDRLQIKALNKENEVLQLQRSLADTAVENSRLYISLLVVSLAFVALMAYRMRRSELHFMNLSRRDGLTDIFNRPHFMSLAERALTAGSDARQNICVVVCDLDHFKKVNDTFGHAAGDTVLKQAAALFQRHLRKDDVLGRLGGEEFGMVLADCDPVTAQQRCEQIRVALAKISIPDSASDFVQSASFGVSCTATAGYELRRLIAEADVALYQAKRTGRNRVVLKDAAFDSAGCVTFQETA